jgi:hypothetical protein
LSTDRNGFRVGLSYHPKQGFIGIAIESEKKFHAIPVGNITFGSNLETAGIVEKLNSVLRHPSTSWISLFNPQTQKMHILLKLDAAGVFCPYCRWWYL